MIDTIRLTIIVSIVYYYIIPNIKKWWNSIKNYFSSSKDNANLVYN